MLPFQLDADSLKEKRKQKMLKAAYEARLRTKLEKAAEQERRQQEEQERKEQEGGSDS